MRDKSELSEGVKKPQFKQPKTSVTIRLDNETIAYFKDLAEKEKMPYQTLINSYLADCAAKKRTPSVTWSDHVHGKTGVDAKDKGKKQPIKITVR